MLLTGTIVVATILFTCKHLVAYSKAEITYTQRHNTKDILQVINPLSAVLTYSG